MLLIAVQGIVHSVEVYEFFCHLDFFGKSYLPMLGTQKSASVTVSEALNINSRENSALKNAQIYRNQNSIFIKMSKELLKCSGFIKN